MEAERDQNGVATLLGVSSVDGATAVRVQVNPGTDNTLIQGLNNPGRVVTIGTMAKRDRNRVVTGYGVRSDNGEPFPLHVTPEGRLLVEAS